MFYPISEMKEDLHNKGDPGCSVHYFEKQSRVVV